MFNRRHFLALASATALASCAPAGPFTPIPPATRLIVLRHADKDDKVLSTKGRARAANLPAALDGVDIDVLYTRNLDRNLATARPLARARGLRVQTLPAAGLEQTLFRGNAGRSIAWIGNSSNIIPLWETLGAPGSPPTDYGDIAILERGPRDRPTVQRLRFEA
ncbi:MAG: histidine phosphatase family protein [Pseudomonadota bacterium]